MKTYNNLISDLDPDIHLPENPTKKDIETEIIRLKLCEALHNDLNEGLKKTVNSIYGVLGYAGFCLYHRDVARTVTGQSRDLIQYAIKITNHFFSEIWHTLTDFHKDHGIISVDKINEEIVMYADTDSMLIAFETLFKNVKFDRELTDDEKFDFMDAIYENLLKNYYSQKFKEYTSKYNAFDLRPDDKTDSFILDKEEMCYSVTMVAKKKYIKDSRTDFNNVYKRGDHITIKGLEINQSAFTEYVRGKLMDMVKFILDEKYKNGDISLMKVSKRLMMLKEEFKVAPVEDICRIERLNNYHEMVLDDVDDVKVASGAKPNIKGAAHYNMLLRKQDNEITSRYPIIKSGSRVAWYYTKTNIGSFSYMVGEYPVEFAPSVDRDMQFEKMIFNPILNIIKTISSDGIDRNFMVSTPLF